MPKRKTAKQKADEAYLRAWGQIDITEQIAQESAQEARGDTISSPSPVDPYQPLTSLPAACPACGAGVQQGLTHIFTHMLKRDAGPYRIMCGQCGVAQWVTEEVWLQVKRQNAARFGGADVKPPKKVRNRQDRGLE